jgi:hypothetical protein
LAAAWKEEMLIPPARLPFSRLIPAIRSRSAAERLLRSAIPSIVPPATARRLRSVKARSLRWARQTELRSSMAMATHGAKEKVLALLSFWLSMFSGAFAA